MENQPTRGGRADPLSAMYFVAAVVMGIAAIIVVSLIFVPQDMFSHQSKDAWVPGTGEVYPTSNAPPETAAQAEQREELHDH
jgi:hypothetical protein